MTSLRAELGAPRLRLCSLEVTAFLLTPRGVCSQLPQHSQKPCLGPSGRSWKRASLGPPVMTYPSPLQKGSPQYQLLTVPEHSPHGTLVGNVTGAVDADEGPNAIVYYFIAGGS